MWDNDSKEPSNQRMLDIPENMMGMLITLVVAGVILLVVGMITYSIIKTHPPQRCTTTWDKQGNQVSQTCTDRGY